MTQQPMPTPSTRPEDETSLIWSIDQRYQRLYGNVTLVCLIAWVLMFGGLVWVVGWQWLLLILLPISFLLMALVMRGAVHSRGAPLYAEAEAWGVAHEGLDALIAHARALEPKPLFFLTLTDGALARHRRGLLTSPAPPSSGPGAPR